jgi:hypothetical protein
MEGHKPENNLQGIQRSKKSFESQYRRDNEIC